MSRARISRPWKLVLWVALLVALDRSFAVFRYPGPRIFAQATDEKAERIAERLADPEWVPEVAIFGSSHALFGIDPAHLFDSADEADRAYNFGLGELGAGQQLALLELLLERGTPARAILVLDYFTLTLGVDAGKRLLDAVEGGGTELPADVRRVSVPGVEDGDRLGASVALSGGRAALGAPRTAGAGAVHVLARQGERWIFEATLVGPPVEAGRGEGDLFGSAVALDGDTLLVGAPRADRAGSDAGAAYVYERGATGWTLAATLEPEDGGAAAFGGAVALNGNRALVGARLDDGAGPNAGAAYVFARSADVWRREAVLREADPARGAQFGAAVALQGDLASVGAPKRRGAGPRTGRGYVFGRGPEGWVEVAYLEGDTSFSEVGAAVAVDDGRVLIAAPGAPATFLCEPRDGAWQPTARLTSPSRGVLPGELRLSGDVAVVGGGRDGKRPALFVHRRGKSRWTFRGALGQEEGLPESGTLAVALDGPDVLVGVETSDLVLSARLRPPSDEPSAGALGWRQRVALASVAYRRREDVRLYVREALHGDALLPILRASEARDAEAFLRFDSFEIDERGFAHGRGAANASFVRRKDFKFYTLRPNEEALVTFLERARERGVRVDVVQAPEHTAANAYTRRYEDFDAFVRPFLEERGVLYHDFNRVEEFPLDRTELFLDTDHLNEEGAALFTRRLGVRLGLRSSE